MDLALLTSLVARQPLIIRSNSEQAPFDLAQICASYSLECETIEPPDLLKTPIIDEDVNVLIVKDLHAVHRNVQIQAIELVRKKSKDPGHFLLIALLPMSVVERPYLTPHLNDLFFFSYTQEPDAPVDSPDPLSKDAISELQKELALVRTSAEIRRYTHDIVTFLRLNRACGGGVSAIATRQLGLLSRVLAVLNGLTYVTPSLVTMAARKIYTHRLIITKPENERSLQWGSEKEAVAKALRGATPESVIEEVLTSVECPL